MWIKPTSAVITPILACLMLASCVEDKGGASDSAETTQPQTNADGTNGSIVKYDGELFSIPSPVQTAILIGKSNAKYNEDLLSDLERVSSYVTETQKAFNLGVLGADLAYLSNFGNKQACINYFKEVERLSSDLDVKSAIDSKIFARFYDNIGNRDSLYAINAEFYRAGDSYLKDSERSEVSALIIAGGWVEAMHFAVDAAQSSPDVRKRVGEQGRALNSLINLLAKFEDEKVGAVKNGLADLQTAFQGLSMEYTYAKPITDAANRTTYINSKSNVVVSDEQLNTIKTKLDAVRNLIIQ